MNKIRNIIVTLGVFAMMIGSSFAMEIDPPTEPVKTTVKTEVAEEVQPPLVGYGYKITSTQCVFLGAGTPGPDCSTLNNGDICTDTDVSRNLYYMSRATEHDPWVCGEVFRKP